MIYHRARELLLQAAVIVLAGLWVYSPAYHGDWLWDDDVLVTANPTVQSGTLSGLLKLWLNPDGLDYFPLSYSLMWLQWQLFGAAPTGYHITTITLHIASGLLLWTLLEKMRLPAAWATALVFTIHPACVESVAWIAETKNTLSLVLFLTSCICWVSQDEAAAGPHRERLYLASLASFLLAMFAKTAVVAMPVLTLLYAWWKRGSVTMQDAIRAAPMFLISLVLGIITIQYQHGRAIGLEELPVGGSVSRLAIAGMAILFYLITIVWPLGLLPIYPQWNVTPPKAWQFLPWLLIGMACWWLWRNRHQPWARHMIFAGGFFLLMIAPVLGFIDISFMRISWVADHFLYLAMIGPLALLVAAATVWLGSHGERGRLLSIGLAGGLVVFLAFTAFRYAAAWSNEDSLWKHTLLFNNDAWQAHNRLGARKLKRGDVEGAHYHFLHSSQLRPDLGETKNNLAIVLMKKGRIDEALKTYEEAAASSPQMLTIRYNLGDAYLQAGRYEQAFRIFTQLLEINPRLPLLLHKRSLACLGLGENEKAIEGFRQALAINPHFSEAQESLKTALGRSTQTTPQLQDNPVHSP